MPQIAIKDWGKKFTSDGLNSLKLETDRKDFELPEAWFHPGQIALWLSEFDVILALWGTQAGKTVTGPHWCLREASRTGPGEGAVVGPNFSLLHKKVVPEFRKVWAPYGEYIGSPIPRFIVSAEGMFKLFGSVSDRKDRWPTKPGEPERDYEILVVHFGYAENSDSLESMTLNWAWSDEAGQGSYKETSYEALERRLLIRRGRHLLTTTPYVWGWLKTRLYDKWLAGETDYVHVLNVPSINNPTMSAERVQRAKDSMPKWRFQMMYEGKFTRPAGAIYDCFTQDGDREVNPPLEASCVRRFAIPRHWQRYQGVDFGNVNTASNWAAMDPDTGISYVYRTYHDGNKEVEAHVTDWAGLEEGLFEPKKGLFGKEARKNLTEIISYGGAPSEDDWRGEFSTHGYAINRPAVRDVEVGIARVYALFKTGKLKVFKDMSFLIGEIETYSRKLNDRSEPTLEIENKASFHRVDALRYLSFGIPLDQSEPSIQPRATKQGPEFTPKEDRDEDDDQPQPKMQRRISRAR